MEFLVLILKNVRRNLLRTILTALGTMILVLVITGIWSILAFIDKTVQEKSRDLKAIVTERWQIPSRMPFAAYSQALEKYAWKDPKSERPLDTMMTWQFYGGTTDPEKRTFDSMIFAIAMEPRKLYTMMDELDSLPAGEKAQLKAVADIMEQKRNGIIVGPGKLRGLNKRVGERFTITSVNYRGIDLEFEVVGEFPPGRYDLSAAFNRDYLNDAIDAYKRKHGQEHYMARSNMQLVWFRFPDQLTFTETADAIENDPALSDPDVKCETASSGISNFLDPYRDQLNVMRYVLGPAILVTLSLIIANSIGISVRERRTEIAVLKVLGFRPWQIMLLVLGEAIALGVIAGSLGAWFSFFVINKGFGGLALPIAFFPKFLIDANALWWGPAIGAGTALVGSIFPAWGARRVKVSEVFSKVA